MNDESEAILDELLALRCRRGDADAWRRLVELFQPRLFYFIRRLVDEERDAWDVLQQTWLAAVRGFGRLQEPRAVRTWLYRIARNRAADRIRQAEREAALIDAQDLCDVPEPTAESTDEDAWPADAATLHVCLAELSRPHREALTLHFLEDLSVDEVATIVGAPAGTVKSRLHHAKRALRAAIERRERPC